MFLGIGRYRTWFTLGSWAEPALGCYIGGIILVRTGWHMTGPVRH